MGYAIGLILKTNSEYGITTLSIIGHTGYFKCNEYFVIRLQSCQLSTITVDISVALCEQCFIS